jgi:FkbM family methyltransferase
LLTDKIKFYGQWNPPVDEVLYRNYFPDKKDGFFIECGAGDGVICSCCLFFEQRRWKGINVEPSAVDYKKLVTNRPNALNLQIGLGDYGHKATFASTIEGPSGLGGFEWTPEQKQKRMEYGCVFQDVEVEITTYRELIGGNVKKVDLFVLDVEGYELKVIKGMVGSKVLPDLICVEYGRINLEDLKKMLLPMGYRFDFLSFNNAFFAMPSLPKKSIWFGKTMEMIDIKILKTPKAIAENDVSQEQWVQNFNLMLKRRKKR